MATYATKDVGPTYKFHREDVTSINYPEDGLYKFQECITYQKDNKETRNVTETKRIRIKKNYENFIEVEVLLDNGEKYPACINKIDILLGKCKLKEL